MLFFDRTRSTSTDFCYNLSFSSGANAKRYRFCDAAYYIGHCALLNMLALSHYAMKFMVRRTISIDAR